MWAVASGNSSGHVGVLLRSRKQIEEDTTLGVLIRGATRVYSGHGGRVNAVWLQSNDHEGQAAWSVISGSDDGSVGLLSRTNEQIQNDAPAASRDAGTLNQRLLVRFDVGPSPVYSASVAGHDLYMRNGWNVACQVRDTVGLVRLHLREPEEAEEISRRAGQTPSPSQLARYGGHCKRIRTVALVGRTQGGTTVWAVASGSDDKTIGLMLRDSYTILSDASKPGHQKRGADSRQLTRYSGHQDGVWAVDIHCREQDGQVVWAVASGSFDQTVGLLLRTTHEIYKEASRDKRLLRGGLLARYGGHNDVVWSVSLNGIDHVSGSLWAVASASADGTFGLLLRNTNQVRQDARCSGSKKSPTRSDLVARYGGYRLLARSVCVRGRRKQGKVVWAVACGSSLDTVGILLRSVQQARADARRSAQGGRWIVPALWARYSGHRGDIITVGLQGQTFYGRQIWVVAAGSSNNSIGIVSRSNEELAADARVPWTQSCGLDAVATWGVARPSILRAANCASGQQTEDSGDKAYWIGTDHIVAAIWQSDATVTDADLRARLVCPLGHVPSFEAMDIAQAPDGIHYMIGGAVGNDVALMPLELLTPKPL